MAIIRRGDINRPLTIEEIDGNFDYLEELASVSGATGPAGATGIQGPTGPAGSGSTPSLQQVTSVDNITTTGIIIDNTYGQSQYSTPYLGGSPQLAFYTNGDGSEFSATNDLSLRMNIEEFFNLIVNDNLSGLQGNIQLQPGNMVLYVQGATTSASILLNNDGFGITTNIGTSYLRTDNVTGSKTYQLPNTNGNIITTSGTDGFPFTGDIEIDSGIYIKSDTSLTNRSVYFTSNETLQINLSSITDSESSIIEVGTSSVDISTTLANGNRTRMILDGSEVYVFCSDPLSAGLVGVLISPENYINESFVQKGYVDTLRPYKVYVALITQSGTASPTAVVFENTLGETPTFTRNADGFYFILSPIFNMTKNWATITNNYYGESTFQIQSDSSGVLYIQTFQGAAATDSMLSNTPIEIRIYDQVI